MIPAKWSEVPVGRVFYAEPKGCLYTKIDDSSAKGIEGSPEENSIITATEDAWVKVFPQRTIYTGRERVEIDECCNGSVLKETVYHAEAHTRTWSKRRSSFLPFSTARTATACCTSSN